MHGLDESADVTAFGFSARAAMLRGPCIPGKVALADNSTVRSAGVGGR